MSKDGLGDLAKTAFFKVIKKRIDHLSTKSCWDRNVPHAIKEMNETLEIAAESLFTTITPLTEREMEELADDLRKLRAFEMVDAAKTHLIKTLTTHGVPAVVFPSTKTTEEA